MIRFILPITCLALLLPTTALGASLKLISDDQVRATQDLRIDVVIDAEDTILNTFSGSITVIDGSIEGISEKNSEIALWIEPPTVEETTIQWSGMIPGGSEDTIEQFSFYIKPLFNGQVTLEATDLVAFLHDGSGTPVKIDPETKIITVQTTDENAPFMATERFDDIWPPEPFTATISYDTSVFEQVPALLFHTVDKDSGIDHYEVSVNNEPFSTARSPFILPPDIELERVRIRAFDRVHNMQESTLTFPHGKRTMGLIPLTLASILLFIVTGYHVIMLKKRKNL